MLFILIIYAVFGLHICRLCNIYEWPIYVAACPYWWCPGLMCCVYRLLSSLWDWYVVFTVPVGLIYCVWLPEGLILLLYVYRPWTVDTCSSYVVFTVPVGLIYCVYCPCGADILCLPFTLPGGTDILFTVTVGLILCYPSLWDWYIVVHCTL